MLREQLTAQAQRVAVRRVRQPCLGRTRYGGKFKLLLAKRYDLAPQPPQEIVNIHALEAAVRWKEHKAEKGNA